MSVQKALFKVNASSISEFGDAAKELSVFQKEELL